MCDSKYKIELSTLQQMKQYVFQEQEELCFIFERLDINNEKTLRLNMNSISRGTAKQEDERALCNYKEGFHHDYLFHSHPITSRSYPSMEDIRKVLKSNKIMVSVIATRWGLYSIKPTSDSRRIAHYWNQDNDYYFSSQILSLVDKIGKMENRMGYKLGNFRYLTHNEEEELNTYISLLVDLTKLEIKFCSWSSMNIS
jgi:hypothetical protein